MRPSESRTVDAALAKLFSLLDCHCWDFLFWGYPLPLHGNDVHDRRIWRLLQSLAGGSLQSPINRTPSRSITYTTTITTPPKLYKLPYQMARTKVCLFFYLLLQHIILSLLLIFVIVVIVLSSKLHANRLEVGSFHHDTVFINFISTWLFLLSIQANPLVNNS